MTISNSDISHTKKVHLIRAILLKKFFLFCGDSLFVNDFLKNVSYKIAHGFFITFSHRSHFDSNAVNEIDQGYSNTEQ